jgi:stress response protein YsnF
LIVPGRVLTRNGATVMNGRSGPAEDDLVRGDAHSNEPEHTRQSTAHENENAVIPLLEETAHVGKRLVETGRVRVRTQTEVTEQILRESLRSDAVGVTRVPVDRVIKEGEIAPQVRTEAGVTIIPVLEEVLVVEKRLVLKEEIHIRQSTMGQDVEVPVTLHKQRAIVERIEPDGTITPNTSNEE